MSLPDIQARIKATGQQAKLIAVSKVQPNERVRAVLEAGHRIFGENKVQEAEGKWPQFRQEFEDIELHLLGPLQ